MASRIALTCPECGISFDVPAYAASKRVYCSRRCKEARQGERSAAILRQIPDRPCVVCGKTFRPRQRTMNGGTPVECCSFACSRLKARKHQRDDITTCQQCGAPLTARQISNMAKYCSRACVGRKNADWHTEPDNKAFMRAHGARVTAQGQRGPTSIERAMMAALDAAGIAYTYQFTIASKDGVIGVADFCIEPARLIIECDGAYWHSLPHVQQRDRVKEAYLRACGYAVVRCSDHDITTDMSGCIARIHAALAAATKP